MISGNQREPDRIAERISRLMNSVGLPAKTLGGKQFWTDHLWRAGWRIQQHAISQHWRLLDPNNHRWAWGTYQECLQRFNDQVSTNQDVRTPIVILLHGLIRTAASMNSLAAAIERELGFQPILFEYASTRAAVADHATALADVVNGLSPENQIHFVGHSLGNIVVRYYWGLLERGNQTDVLRRIRSVVMLGPPNQGAALARQLDRLGLLQWITGQSGMELGPSWEELQKKLAIPSCPFAVIAGVVRSSQLINPLTDGPGDLVVSAKETFLEGASLRLEVQGLHSFLMNCTEVQAATIEFLKSHA